MYVLGIDVGTTGTKALLIDEKGLVAAKAYRGYELRAGSDGVVEQNPQDWWDAVVAVVREATERIANKSEVAALSLSTQGASSVLLDSHFKPFSNAITWMDTRAAKEKHELEALDEDDRIYRTTGWRLNESLDAAKLLWYRNNERERFDAAYAYVSTMEYVIQNLTGEIIVDPTNAAIRQLMNINASQWDMRLLDFIGFPASKMPQIMPSGTLAGVLTSEAAGQTGLEKTTRVYLGAHDQYCAALGSGALEAKDMVLSTGTAWVMLGITRDPMFTPTYISPARYVTDELWGALSSIPVAGASLEWLRKTAPDEYTTIDKNAALRMEKTKDLFFFPHFTGARYPVWQPKAKAGFLGINLEHDRYDLYRAIMEGVAFQIRLGLDDFSGNGVCINKLSVTGGAVKSRLWLDIIAATTGTGTEISSSSEADAACVGAAMIAAVSEGIFASYKIAANSFLKPQVYNEADPKMTERYSEKFERYKSAWEQVSKIY